MGEAAPTWIELDVTHPDCWTLDVTASVDVELLSQHVNSTRDGTVRGYFIACGDSTSAMDRALDEVERSDLTERTYPLGNVQTDEFISGQGKTARGLIVEYRSENSITETLTGQGFLVQRPVRIRDGVEHWTVIEPAGRDRIREKLEAVTDRMDADVTITRLSSTATGGAATDPGPQLTGRQREVFDHARSRGYYAWPRETTAGELADELGITKPTLLEHLHKVESKLLDPNGPGLSSKIVPFAGE